MHDEEASGDLTLSLRPFAIGRRWITYRAMKESAERTETLKPDFEADVSHAKFVPAEQFFCFLYATFDQVLMRGLVVCLTEETEKMIPRKTGLLRNLFEAERMVVAVIDEITRPAKPL